MESQPEYPLGRVVIGDKSSVAAAYERFRRQPVDLTMLNDGKPYPYSMFRTTLAAPATVSGPGTFEGKKKSTLTFSASEAPGWWIDRTDQPEQFPVGVSVRNVWTTARNIVLRSGNPHNYLRMVEHIIAFRLGLGIDNLTISVASGDPPLFNRGNLDIYEAIEKAGVINTPEPASFITVKEPLTFGGNRGDFLTFLPAKPGEFGLRVDCAIDFASVIGKQRILFDVTPDTFRIGSEARTNAPLSAYVYTRTLGKLFADTRNLGYTKKNILIHGKKKYLNEPNLFFADRSLEPVWHRATLDLLAAVSLLDAGRFCGTIVSYRAGHTQDVQMCSYLELHKHLVEHH